MQLFGSDPKMIALGSKALLVQGVMFLTFGFQMVYASLYLSVGKGLAGSLLSLGRQGIFFIPLILMLPRIWGIGGLLLTQPVADLLAAAVTVYFAAGTNRHLGMGERKEKTYR